MPHCKIEYSANLIEEINFNDFFQKLHTVLTSDNLFKINDIKSRAIKFEDYFIGNDNHNKCFVAVTISILTGRTTEVKKRLSENVLEFLKDQFSDSLNKLDCNLTVRIDEIEKESYSKFNSGKTE